MTIDDIKDKMIYRMNKLETMNQYARIDELALLLTWVETGDDY